MITIERKDAVKLIAPFALLFIASSMGIAQSATTPLTPPPEFGWKQSLIAGLTLTQVAFTDWAEGGDNALAYSLTTDGKSALDEENANWTSTYKFAFGQARLGNLGLRKTDDVIDFSTVYTYKLGTFINPYGAASI